MRQYLSIANSIKIRLFIPLNNGLFFCTKGVYDPALLVNNVLFCEMRWLVLHRKQFFRITRYLLKDVVIVYFIRNMLKSVYEWIIEISSLGEVMRT